MLFILSLSTGLNVQSQTIAKYSNDFLTLGVGARALGMSKSVVASTSDITSAFFNPAGLNNLEDNLQLGYMHSAYWSGIANYDYGAIGFKIKDQGAMAISMIRFGIDNIPNTFDLIRNGQIDYSRISSFSAVDYAFILSYARKGGNHWKYGGNAKIIHRKAGPFGHSWGFGLDASLQYHSEKEWMFGLMARDLTSTFNAWRFSFSDYEKEILSQTGNTIPQNSLEITLPAIIAGVGKKISMAEKVSLLFETNAVITTDGKRNTLLSGDPFSIDPSLGMELGYKDMVFLRAGLGNFQRGSSAAGQSKWLMEPNAGLGLVAGPIHIDYALSTIGKQITGNYTHIFSVKFAINKTEKSAGNEE